MDISRKKRRHRVAEPHMINLDGQYGPWVYQSRLQRERSTQSPLVVESYEFENNQILGMASFLNQLCGDAVISHPQTGIKCVINHNMDPKSCYLLSNGAYQQSCLSLIKTYINLNDCVAILGGGIGLLPVIISSITKKITYVWEPSKSFHSIILKNARLNDTGIEICQDIIDLSKFIPKINTLIIDLSKQDASFFTEVSLDNLKRIIIFKGDTDVDEKFTAHFISEIMRHNFTMDTMLNGSYVFVKV